MANIKVISIKYLNTINLSQVIYISFEYNS